MTNSGRVLKGKAEVWQRCSIVSWSTQGSNVDSRGLLGKIHFNGFYKCGCLLNPWFTLKIYTLLTPNLPEDLGLGNITALIVAPLPPHTEIYPLGLKGD